jgi:hypothetical protein
MAAAPLHLQDLLRHGTIPLPLWDYLNGGQGVGGMRTQ